MKDDFLLIAMVFVIWLALAAIYFTVPMLYMPATGRVWGMGAALFLGLAGLILWAGRRARKARSSGQA